LGLQRSRKVLHAVRGIALSILRDDRQEIWSDGLFASFRNALREGVPRGVLARLDFTRRREQQIRVRFFLNDLSRREVADQICLIASDWIDLQNPGASLLEGGD